MQVPIDRMQQSKSSKFSILLNSSMIGVWRGLIGLPFEHPFDSIKTNMQAYQAGFFKTLQNIYQKKGFLGFYSGFSVNSIRIATKQIYRWPLQIGLFGFYKKIFGDNISRGTLGMICGFNMALIEVVVITPFERLKVWLMTAKEKSRMREFFQQFSIKSLFDGLMPVFIKQFISWISFLGFTQYLKDFAYKYSGKNRYEQDLSKLQMAMISCAVASIHTTFVMPVDCIKTHFQRNKTGELNNNDEKKSHKFMRIVKQIHQKYGILGFYKGWQVKLFQYGINSILTIFMLQKLLKQYEKKIFHEQKNKNHIL